MIEQPFGAETADHWRVVPEEVVEEAERPAGAAGTLAQVVSVICHSAGVEFGAHSMREVWFWMHL
jgi:hypothetical protein